LEAVRTGNLLFLSGTLPIVGREPKFVGADGASELLENIFGKTRLSSRTVLGVESLPLGVAVEIEITLEVEGGSK